MDRSREMVSTRPSTLAPQTSGFASQQGAPSSEKSQTPILGLFGGVSAYWTPGHSQPIASTSSSFPRCFGNNPSVRRCSDPSCFQREVIRCALRQPFRLEFLALCSSRVDHIYQEKAPLYRILMISFEAPFTWYLEACTVRASGKRVRKRLVTLDL